VRLIIFLQDFDTRCNCRAEYFKNTAVRHQFHNVWKCGKFSDLQFYEKRHRNSREVSTSCVCRFYQIHLYNNIVLQHYMFINLLCNTLLGVIGICIEECDRLIYSSMLKAHNDVPIV